MPTTITGKLNKNAQIFSAGESTGFGIRVGVKFYDQETKQEEWTNYQAVVFAKSAAQVQLYTQALVEGTIVEITGDKQRIRQYQSHNGLLLSIEILDAKLGFIGGGNPRQLAAPQHAEQSLQQAMPMYGGYANNTFGQSIVPPVCFSGDIPSR